MLCVMPKDNSVIKQLLKTNFMSETRFLHIVTPGFEKSISLDNILSFVPKGGGTEFVLKETIDGKNTIYFCPEPYQNILSTIRILTKPMTEH